MNRYFNMMIGIWVFLLTPVITCAANNSGYNSGQIAGKCLSLIIMVWGIYKSFSIARRKTTNTKCTIALGLSLAGYFFINAGTIAQPYFAYPRSVIIISVIFATVFFITSMVLAVIGLIEYSQKFTQGKKQAIWAIVINSLFIIMVLWGAIQVFANHENKNKIMYAKDEHNRPIMDSDLNFTLEVPGKPYAKIKPETINPFAKVAFVRANPQIFYMLIPQRMGIDQAMKTEGLLEIAQAYLKGGAQRVEIGQSLNKVINGMNGLYFVSGRHLCSLGLCQKRILLSTDSFFRKKEQSGIIKRR